MKLKAPFLEILKNTTIGVAAIYAVMLVLTIFPLLGVLVFKLNIRINTNGTSFVMVVASFIIGLIMVKQNVYLMCQMGVSRTTTVIACGLSIFLVSLGVSVLDLVFQPLVSWLSLQANVEMSINLTNMFIEGRLGNFLWSFAFYVFFGFVGFLLSSINLRLSTIGRWIFWVLGPAFIFIFCPVSAAKGGIMATPILWLGKFFVFTLGLSESGQISIWRFPSFLVLFAVIMGTFSWLVLRKVSIKNR